MPSSPVAVIDVGSNSIKLLVAQRASDGHVNALASKTLEARISAGISQTSPRLSDEGMERGIDAVQQLLALAAGHHAEQIVIVATSAVRDATNGADFAAHLKSTTGQALRVLSGDDEANLIGRGLRCDPALTDLRDYYLFDLGGGSLECLAFRDRRAEQSISLRLGCVRLTEKFVSDPTRPFSPAGAAAIARHVRTELTAARFLFDLPRSAEVVGTGGTFTTARAILAVRAGRSFEAADPVVTVSQLRDLFDELAAMPLAKRHHVDGLARERADVFPTALATLLTLAELGGLSAFRNSLYNLRWGVADELLASS